MARNLVNFRLLLEIWLPPGNTCCPGNQAYGIVNTLRPKQNGRHFADDTFKHIFLNENVGISIKISLKFVPKGPINNIPALVQVMAWRRPGDKPLTEPMVLRLQTHTCVTRPQWVKHLFVSWHMLQAAPHSLNQLMDIINWNMGMEDYGQHRVLLDCQF